jgi:hypothetical protein
MQLIEDGSRYWGWEIDRTHPDSTGMIFLQHMANIENADEDQAKVIVSVLLAKNRVAFLWAQLLMAGAQRPEVYASLLWELATNEQILLCPDTTKAAIDAIAAFYPSRTEEERKAFEEKVFAYGEDDLLYQAVHKEILDILFQTIGEQNLITEKARSLSVPAPGEPAAVNQPAFSMTGGAVPYELRDRLIDHGVDLEAPAHSGLMALIDEISAKTRFNDRPRPEIKDIPAAVGELRRLVPAIAEAENQQADANLVRAARNLLSNGSLSILHAAQKDRVVITDGDLSTLLEITLSLSRAAGSGPEESFRVEAVGQLYLLCRHSNATRAAIKRLTELAHDPGPAVRHAIVQNLWVLFEHAPPKMWKIAEFFAKSEDQPFVLAQLVASTFRMLRNHDPGRIESMVLRIRDRFPYNVSTGNRDPRESLWEHSAQVMAALYVWNDRKKSRDLLFDCAANPVTYVDQIRSALYEVRQAVCRGYDADSPELKAARERIQALLAKVVDHSAAALETYYALGAKKQKEKQAEAKAFAHCLEYACASLFFGSGAFRENNLDHASPVVTDAGKRKFVKDIQPMLSRLGDIAIPHTVYELVQLLDFLLPGEPAVCFDLFAHALTMTGQKHGFQGESLGVDVLVRVVSRSLADHDHIFRDKARRDKLVAILDIFIEAGWPNALRLLYRLPDSLR